MSINIFKMLFVIVFIAAVKASNDAGYDHCSKNNFDTNSTYMQFTKEVVSKEFATKGAFKSLHCCAKGYRSIEWYKDDKPYPWPSDSSSFILYPEAANQTIYTRSATVSDRGNYTCRLRNDTHLTSNNVELEILEQAPDNALINFISKDQPVEIGSPVRLYCEAFVGRISLPDARSVVNWRHTLEGEFEQRPHNGTERTITRENGDVVGAYLDIPAVKRHHLGRYDCNVRLAGSDDFIRESAILYDSGVSIIEDTRWENSLYLVMAGVVAVLSAIVVILITRNIYNKIQMQNSGVCGKMANKESRV